MVRAQNDMGGAGTTEPLKINEVADSYVNTFVELRRAKITADELEARQRKLALRVPVSRGGSRATTDPVVLKEITSLADWEGQLANERLVVTLADAKKQTSTLTGRWRKARADLLSLRDEQLKVGGDRDTVSRLAFLLSANNKWFWLCGLIALVAPAGAALFERRQELRRALQGGKGRSVRLVKIVFLAFVVLAVLAGVVFVAGDLIYMRTLVRASGQSASPLDEDRRATEENAREIQKVQDRLGTTIKSNSEGEGDLQELGGATQQRIAEAGAALKDLGIELQLQKEVLEAYKADSSKLKEIEEKIGTDRHVTANYRARQGWIQLGLGLLLLAGTAGLGFLVHAGMRKRAELTAETCPLCLTVGKLKPVNLGGSDTPGLAQPEMVECLASGCDFAFLSMYRSMQKLCFPTLGLTRTGKTHWVAEIYRQLKQGNYKRQVQFEKVKSASSEEFDRIVEGILNYRSGTGTTQTGKLPHPLVFNFLDQDWPVRSNALVNIFDYGGEVTSGRTLDDYARRRALDADGYFYFLDPTLSSNDQAHALDMFKEDVAAIKGVKVGQSLRCPVALMVSKLDLMVNQPYASKSGQDFVTRFYRQLNDLDPTGTQVTLDLIKARSLLFAKLRDIIWPGWQIERLVDELFGGRVMYFPLTPVGMNEPGETNLAKRTINPYLILEPLLWMLHMNGYPVLK